jgi:hypothetical protein
MSPSALKPSFPLLFAALSGAGAVFTPAAAASEFATRSGITESAAADIAATFMSISPHQPSEATSNMSSTADSENQASSEQSVNAVANTGYNEASRNISFGGNAGTITTGDAQIAILQQAGLNSGGASVAASGDASAVSADQASATSLTAVSGKNGAIVYQQTDANATTGHNVADRNISFGGAAGSITTGDAGVAVGYMVAANDSVLIIGGTPGSAGPGSGASVVILTTGGSSRYSPSIYSLDSTTASTAQTAFVSQTCGGSAPYEVSMLQPTYRCSAITGGNTSDRNISRTGDAGVITTGDAVVVVDTRAQANTSNTSLSSPTQPSAQLSGGQSAHLSNTVASTLFQSADAKQQVAAVADTGHNTANRNISFGGDAGTITTGNAVILIYLQTLLNTAAATL